MPTRKYQNEGGPSPVAIVELLRATLTDREADVATFAAALGFNWLIGGTDSFLGRLQSMARQLPDEISAARELARGQGLDAPVIERLAAQLVERAHGCQRLLGGS